MVQIIKTGVLKFMAGNDPGHIREIHIKAPYAEGRGPLLFRKLHGGD
jgi:hypothetical protein